MKRSVVIQENALDEAALLASREMSRAMGAAVYFLGVVREMEGENQITGIDYEAHEKMALHQFGKILDEVETKWPIETVRLVHRVGMVRVNEPSLWVEVISGHRGEAFAACQYLIDEMKKRVPIWKKTLGPE